ncbi:MAG TPA: Tad domain-containing protein [Candidatus Nitrosotalea sp.]|nr:Tad domain-containing protein [Candidatus Nitrosotalea sp.]
MPKGTRQNGQAIVLAAGAMAVLLSMVGLLLMSGTSYWQSRHLQELADSAALAGAIKIASDCPSTGSSAVTAAAAILDLQLGTASGGVGGSCSSQYVASYHFSGNVTATVSYPYLHDATKIEVALSQVSPFQLAGFVGASQGTVVGRAVAQFSAGSPPNKFAIFAQDSVSCQGSTIMNVAGSVYSHDLPQGNGGCEIYTQAIKDSSGNYVNFGRFETWQDPPANFWACLHFCSDGYQLAGHSAGSIQCGVSGSSQYLDPAQLALSPNPCASGNPPAVQNYAAPTYQDPNTAPPNPSTGLYTASQVCSRPAAPSYTDAAGWGHYVPGCYDTIVLGANSVLDPGFYYFNGKGLFLNDANQLLGQDVTLEFVNSSSFSLDKTNGQGSCGNTCAFGANPVPPGSGPDSAFPNDQAFAAPTGSGATEWCFQSADCPDSGMLIYSTSTGTFQVDGPHSSSFFQGSIYWPNGTCIWYSNGTGNINGQLVCQNVVLQGGSSSTGAGVSYSSGSTANATAEAALTE